MQRKSRMRLGLIRLVLGYGLVALVVGVALGFAQNGAATSVRSPSRSAVPRLLWHGCGPMQKGFQCATARVPLDYRHPAGPTIHLAVIRHRATGPGRRIGTLFFNPGGPGQSGTSALPQLYEGLQGLAPAVPARFDIASWDPRGVGRSTAVKCFATAKDEGRFLHGMVATESFPMGPAQMDRWIQRYRSFDQHCARRNGSLLGHVSTADTARDLDLLRGAVGDRRLSYYGTSYGTFLGATYANLFPARVRALVLDGNINPKAWVDQEVKANGGWFLPTWLRQHTDQGAAKTLNAFLDLCGRANTANCAFSAGSAAATRAKFATLLRRLRAHPRGAATYAQVVSLAGAELGETANWSTPGLAGCFQEVRTTGDLSACKPPVPPLGPLFAISCSESPNPGPAGFRSLDGFAYRRSGPMGLSTLWQGLACASWPVRAADRYTGPWDRRTASPILVIGNTHDPNTPYRGAVAMARQLARARLLTVDGYGHTALSNNPSACMLGDTARYLIDGALPPKGARCPQAQQPFTPSP